MTEHSRNLMIYVNSSMKEEKMKKSLGAATLIVPTPVWVVGTYDEEGKANVMTAAWGGICCSDPPCVAVALRAATYSHAGIMARKAFTVSVPGEKYVAETDYWGMASGRDGDKFAAAGLIPEASTLVDAPYVKEFPLILECELQQSVEVGQHTQFIGRIVDVKADEEVLDNDGKPDLEKIRPAIFSPGNRSYYATGKFLGKGFSIGKNVTK
jgi:flavin reductase (DIM6/NTAB) family NADH-FMN oxidoreductase RutF